MDPVSVITTAYSLINFILEWNRYHEEAAKSLHSLPITVQAIQLALSKVDPHKPNIAGALTALTDCLNDTKEILEAANSKIKKLSQWLFPSKVVQKVNEMESQMMKFVGILTLAVSIENSASVGAGAERHSALEFITNVETRDFWARNFGEERFAVSWAELETALRWQYQVFVDDAMLADLKMCLDNFKTGSVSCFRLSEFIGAQSISWRLQEYLDKVNKPKPIAIPNFIASPPPAVPSSPSITPNAGNPGWFTEAPGDIILPLLLWVDDNPENNEEEIAYAKQKGIDVVKLLSTSEAKQWIKNNPSVMELEDFSGFHIVTDNARRGKGTVLDINAGEDIVRFVRGRRCKVPIMVYCGDLNYTKYTANYPNCKAANVPLEVQKFIDELKRP